MSRKHANPPNQNVMAFVDFARAVNRANKRADPGPGPTNPIHLAACGQDDGPGPPLANADAGRVAGLRNEGRQDWFVDDDPDEPDAAA